MPLILIPREHGSWGMLLFPFISAAILTHTWSWDFLPATVAVLAVFLLREPLVVLFRQHYVWTSPRPEATSARTSIAILATALAAAGLWLLSSLPLLWLLGLGAAAALLTVVYVYGTIQNLQRSPLLQILGAAGLTASAVIAYLAGGRAPDTALVLLLAAHVVHNAGSVLVVHARLEATRALRRQEPGRPKTTAALLWLIGHACTAAIFALLGRHLLALALLIPLAIHAADLARLTSTTFLRVPLRRVGFRELGLSTVFSVLVLVALW